MGRGRAEVHALPEATLSVGHAQAPADVRQAMFVCKVLVSGFLLGGGGSFCLPQSDLKPVP